MIVVTVGSSVIPFDRLVGAVDSFSSDEHVLVQTGPSKLRPARAECVDFLSYDDLARAVSRARVVVAHAGVGSTVLALSNGLQPILVPRLARFGEAIDDHQLYFARRFSESGLVTLIEDVALLSEAVKAAREPRVRELETVSPLVSEIEVCLDGLVGGSDAAGS